MAVSLEEWSFLLLFSIFNIDYITITQKKGTFVMTKKTQDLKPDTVLKNY